MLIEEDDMMMIDASRAFVSSLCQILSLLELKNDISLFPPDLLHLLCIVLFI